MIFKGKRTLSWGGVASRKKESCISLVIYYTNVNITLYTSKNFALDGKETNLSENDIARRNTPQNY